MARVEVNQMTKSARRKDKVEGRPQWVASDQRCEECGSMLVRTGMGGYTCTACGLTQTLTKKLPRPPRARKGNVLANNVVFKKSKSQDVEQLHMAIGMRKKLYCSDCGKKFFTPQELAQHQEETDHQRRKRPRTSSSN